MKIRSVDFVFMALAFVCFMVSLFGFLLTEGVQQRPFIVISPCSLAIFLYLGFRVELGGKLK